MKKKEGRVWFKESLTFIRVLKATIIIMHNPVAEIKPSMVI